MAGKKYLCPMDPFTQIKVLLPRCFVSYLCIWVHRTQKKITAKTIALKFLTHLLSET